MTMLYVLSGLFIVFYFKKSVTFILVLAIYSNLIKVVAQPILPSMKQKNQLSNV